MADEKMERAQQVFNALCAAMDADDWHYEKNEEKLEIKCGAQGEDLPMKIHVIVDPEKQIIILLSPLPFIIPENKRLDGAIAVSVANNGLVDGSFDYDIKDGSIFFRMTSSFIESEIGSELFHYMLLIACHTIDEYNDKFLMVGKGMMSIEDFIAKDTQEG